MSDLSSFELSSEDCLRLGFGIGAVCTGFTCGDELTVGFFFATGSEESELESGRFFHQGQPTCCLRFSPDFLRKTLTAAGAVTFLAGMSDSSDSVVEGAFTFLLAAG